MRVFMLGWEFPPFISGGLGTACYGLTKAMSSLGTDVMYVLPRPVSTPFSTHVRLVSPRPDSPLAAPTTEFRLDEFEHVTFRTVNAAISNPYQTPAEFTQQVAEAKKAARAVPVQSGGEKIGSTTTAPAQKPAAAPAEQKHNVVSNQSAYGGELFSEIQRYANLATEISRQEHFEVVHAQHWLTFPSGL